MPGQQAVSRQSDAAFSVLLNPRFAASRYGPEGPEPRLGGFRNAVSGQRFYSPNLGRFINRDPIKEQGGINLKEKDEAGGRSAQFRC